MEYIVYETERYTVHMHIRTLIIAALLIVPGLASAATFGFPREPLWVSSTSAIEGETVTMYVALYNSSEAEMKGAVVFLADGTAFDTKDVSLAPGDSSLISSGWKATKGSHALSAQFASGDAKDTTQKITVSITAAPPSPPAEPTIINQTVQTIQNFAKPVLASTSPVGKVAGAMMEQTEKVRTAGADFIRPYAEPEKKLPQNSAQGTSFIALPAAGGDSLIDKATQMAASAALFAFDTEWLFYALAILLLYLLFRTIKRWVNRPRF